MVVSGMVHKGQAALVHPTQRIPYWQSVSKVVEWLTRKRVRVAGDAFVLRPDRHVLGDLASWERRERVQNGAQSSGRRRHLAAARACEGAQKLVCKVRKDVDSNQELWQEGDREIPSPSPCPWYWCSIPCGWGTGGQEVKEKGQSRGPGGLVHIPLFCLRRNISPTC